MNNIYTIKDAIVKLEHFCAYQERCHAEVVSKLYSLKMSSDEIDVIVVHLIENNFLNESRFACSFARGKHRIKNWGKIRITNELKARHISSVNITLALKEITPDEYEATFDDLSEKCWNGIHEKMYSKREKKFCDYMLRRGYESNLVYEKAMQLEKENGH